MSSCPCARYAHSYLKANRRINFITQPDVALRETLNECSRAIGPNELLVHSLRNVTLPLIPDTDMTEPPEPTFPAKLE